ncbi:hypothetical protein TTRE_0000212101 [Trichuris trichiura]|uniref:Uncharacterized protein n=1 Tax=Trichuris trichiura TaxID=36087 RepID=A0A077Z1R4_TRITR|nr:hypothetical protein TTRE_0000212101 [Trichuris trichiura]
MSEKLGTPADELELLKRGSIDKHGRPPSAEGEQSCDQDKLSQSLEETAEGSTELQQQQQQTDCSLETDKKGEHHIKMNLKPQIYLLTEGSQEKSLDSAVPESTTAQCQR